MPKTGSQKQAGLHLIKLAVGVEDYAHLSQLQATRMADNAAAGLGPYPRHVTRQRPRRASELLDGGSIYWVVKGVIRARQHIRALEDVIDADGVSRCAIVLEADLRPTQAKPHRAFQGWRYLDPAKAPKDASGNGPGNASGDDVQELPGELVRTLDNLGLL